MAKINSDLLATIMKATKLQRAQVYARIKQVADAEFLPRELAAIKVAAESGVTINKYASADDLFKLRQAGSPVTPPNGSLPITNPILLRNTGKPGKKAPKKPANQVFVVHGRDRLAKEAMFGFLRSIGVKPIEWNTAIAMTKKASPYIGDILNVAFENARAVVVLLTPDDLAQLRPDLLSHNDKPYERTLTGQARPNVLFEAGMAFATHPDKTVMVQLGNVREFSDVAGRHIVHMSDSFPSRQELATKLRNAGCDVDTSGTDWVKAGNFTDPMARTPKSD